MNMKMIIFVYLIINQIQLNTSQDNTQWRNFLDLVKNFGPENCPRCASPNECYQECDSRRMQEFTGIANWADCKDQCLALGGDFAYEFDTHKSDRGCAMYSQKDLGKCVCVPGQGFACRNIASGRANCPQCGGIFGKGAPRCLAECDVDKRREFEDIADWGDCKDRCKSLGGLYTYQWGTWNSNRACAIYAQYDNMGSQGKCVCVRGSQYACDNSAHADAPPAILSPDMDQPEFDEPNFNEPEFDEPPSMPALPAYPAPQTRTISFAMIEGYGIGVITTLVILLIGLFIACLSRRWKSNSNSKIYAKVNYTDSEDERIVINNGINE